MVKTAGCERVSQHVLSKARDITTHLDLQLESAIEDLQLVLWDELRERNQEASLQRSQAVILRAIDDVVVAEDGELQDGEKPRDYVAADQHHEGELEKLSSTPYPLEISPKEGKGDDREEEL